jgi:hypothetical protein
MSAPVQKSKEKAALQSVTANRLHDGAVVFRSETGSWSTRLSDAAVAADPTVAAQLLAGAERDAANAVVVGPYLFAVTRKDGALQAATLRERIRAAGPTVLEAGVAIAAIPYL